MGRHAGWQKFEERIARLFGGRRRGAATSRGRQGLNDVVGAPGWSVECKLLARPSYADLLSGCRQAEAAAADDELPVCVTKRKNALDDDALVVMRLATFREWFLPPRGDTAPEAGAPEAPATPPDPAPARSPRAAAGR